MFSGDIVSADHLRRQYGLVVGEEGVRRIVELDEANRANNNAIRAAESELNAVVHTIGPPAMKVDDFLALKARPDIGKAIADKDSQVQCVRRANELKAAAEPSRFPVPTETE